MLEDNHGMACLRAYFNSVTHRGGPYHTPCRRTPEGIYYDFVEMTRSQWRQWNMRTHFDLLDVGDEC